MGCGALSRLFFALAAATIAVPAAAQSADDAGLLRTVRAIGDATSGQRIGSGRAADKIVYLGRNGGRIVVTSIAALVPGGEWVDPPGGAIAVLRTRASTPGNNGAPDPADLAYVQRTGLRVFIVGEWATPPVIWEIARQDGQARVREIDARGVAGPWRAPAG